MNKLSKEKRNQLVAVLLGTVAIVAGLYFTLIRMQRETLHEVEVKKAERDASLTRTRDTIKNSKQIEAELLVVSNQLQLAEEDMATGDLYSSMYESIRKFKAGYEIDIPNYSSAGVAVDVNLLPKYPYKQVTMTVAGTAYYYDLGRFVADFENKFPSSRILNLELSPAAAQGPDEREKLSFKLDIVSLVKAGGPHP